MAMKKSIGRTLADIDVAANTSVRIHGDFFNTHRISQHLTASIETVIPMIPVLDEVKECNRIGDESLREKCRQLNTYRAAFVNVDSYEEVKKDKELCNAVDHAGVSKTCLWQLDLYVANPAYTRPMKPQVN